ncbi:hypothetical protein QVD99_000796 [Batrachochytrium dendrobatidis]|nr:hypothetical protein QVD99_000796 [Batrachochytrium dendrobatidis]
MPGSPELAARAANSNSEGRNRMKHIQSALRLTSSLSAIKSSELVTAKQNLVSPRWTREIFHPNTSKDNDMNGRKRSIGTDLWQSLESNESRLASQPTPTSKSFGHKSPIGKDTEYDPNTFDILDVPPKEIARQLTLLSSDYFRNITRAELTSMAWTSSDKEKITPAIVQITNHFNQIAIWVAHQILKAKTSKERFQLICYFIRVSKGCLDCNNFDSVRSIVAGLQSTPVHRLERTWAMIGRRERAVFDKIAEIASMENNNDTYRRRLENTKPPFVPYLGTHLGDITFTYECLKKDKGNPQRIQQYEERDTQFNQLIDDIERWKSTCIYNFPRIKCILDAITHNVIHPDQLRGTQDDHYRLSYLIEARSGPAPISIPPTKTEGEFDLTTDKGRHSMRKFDFSLKTNVGTAGAFLPMVSSNRRGKQDKTTPSTPQTGVPPENNSLKPGNGLGVDSGWPDDYQKNSDSDSRSWTLPSKKPKRERPRLDNVFVMGNEQFNIPEVLQNSNVKVFESESETPTTSHSDSYSLSAVSPWPQPPLNASHSGSIKSAITRDRSSSTAADSSIGRDSYRQKVVNGIMKPFRRPQSESHSHVQDAIDTSTDRDQASFKNLLNHTTWPQKESKDSTDIQIARSSKYSYSSNQLDDEPGSLSSLKSLTSVGSKTFDTDEFQQDNISVTSQLSQDAFEATLEPLIRHTRAKSEGGLFTSTHSIQGVTVYAHPARLVTATISEVEATKPVGKLTRLLQGVLFKKDVPSISGQRSTKRDWIQVWCVLEENEFTLYQYDKNMKGPTFIAASTRRQLCSPTGSKFPSRSPENTIPGKSMDALLPKSRGTSPQNLESVQVGGSLERSHAEGLIERSQAEDVINSTKNVSKDSPSKVGWNITESFADLSFPGSKNRLKKDAGKAVIDSSVNSSNTLRSTADIIEKITFSTITKVDTVEGHSKQNNVFMIQISNDRKILLQASSLIEMQSWVEAIRAGIEALNMPF